MDTFTEMTDSLFERRGKDPRHTARSCSSERLGKDPGHTKSCHWSSFKCSEQVFQYMCSYSISETMLYDTSNYRQHNTYCTRWKQLASQHDMHTLCIQLWATDRRGNCMEIHGSQWLCPEQGSSDLLPCCLHCLTSHLSQQASKLCFRGPRLLNWMLTFVYLIAQDTTYASIKTEQNEGIIEAKFCLAAIECYLRKQCFFFLNCY